VITSGRRLWIASRVDGKGRGGSCRTIPEEHRTDWGEAAARALRDALDQLNPAGVTASITKASGGGLRVVVNGATKEQRVRIVFWEDEAVVRSEDEKRKFKCVSPDHRWWHLGGDPGHDWIPELVEYVVERVARWSD
jgi:hypothetical protein